MPVDGPPHLSVNISRRRTPFRLLLALGAAWALAAVMIVVGVTTTSASPSSAGPTVVVAKGGSGQYTTVQAAVNAVPANNTQRHTINIKPGTYRQLVTVPSNKPFVSFTGTTANASDVVITYDNASGTPKPDGSGTYGTTGSSSVFIDANDFIFGRGTAVLDRCEIRALNRGSTSNNGYLTAASTSKSNPYGFLFTQSRLTAASDVAAKSVHLGRPWHPGGDVNAIAQVLFRESTMNAHIKDSPWTDMSGFSWRNARFSEYRNTGPGATITADRPQLAASQAPNHTAQRYLAGGDGWNPIS